MLTVETLRQSPSLASLSEEQLSAIAEMSRNDENTVIGTRIGTLHGQYDQDIFSITGVKKKDGEKSYDYAKRVLGEYKTKADAHKALQDELTSAKASVAELQSKLEKGVGDEAIAQQLKDAKAQVTQLQAQLKAKEAALTAKQAEFDESLKNVHVDYAFQAATSGLKFKTGITEPIQKTLLNAAKTEILSKGTPDFIDNASGSKILVFRGTDGNILNNPKNNLNPYTVQELVMETSLKDVIDTGRQQTGGGTSGNGASGNGGTNLLDLSGAKNQVEADNLIVRHLLSEGLTRDSLEFGDKLVEIRNENHVADLPLR